MQKYSKSEHHFLHQRPPVLHRTLAGFPLEENPEKSRRREIQCVADLLDGFVFVIKPVDGLLQKNFVNPLSRGFLRDPLDDVAQILLRYVQLGGVEGDGMLFGCVNLSQTNKFPTDVIAARRLLLRKDLDILLL